MANHSGAVHHQHIRKRIHKKHEEYPHPNLARRTLDEVVLLASFVSPIMTIPQALKIFQERDGRDISLVTWGTYLVGSCIWLAYGLAHKEKPIITSNILFIIVNLAVLAGAIMYG